MTNHIPDIPGVSNIHFIILLLVCIDICSTHHKNSRITRTCRMCVGFGRLIESPSGTSDRAVYKVTLFYFSLLIHRRIVGWLFLRPIIRPVWTTKCASASAISLHLSQFTWPFVACNFYFVCYLCKCCRTAHRKRYMDGYQLEEKGRTKSV